MCLNISGGKMLMIETERISMRDYRDDEFELMNVVLSNPQVMRYAYMDTLDTPEKSKKYFGDILENGRKTEGRTLYECPVFLKSTGELAGYGGIMIKSLRPEGGIGEIGYFFLPEYWGKGFATELAKSLTRFCFEKLKLHKVTATCNVRNHASEHVMQKCGMIREGVLRSERFKNGEWMDELYYGLLKEEYLKE